MARSSGGPGRSDVLDDMDAGAVADDGTAVLGGEWVGLAECCGEYHEHSIADERPRVKGSRVYRRCLGVARLSTHSSKSEEGHDALG